MEMPKFATVFNERGKKQRTNNFFKLPTLFVFVALRLFSKCPAVPSLYSLLQLFRRSSEYTFSIEVKLISVRHVTELLMLNSIILAFKVCLDNIRRQFPISASASGF